MSYIDTVDYELLGFFAGLPLYHPLEVVAGSGSDEFGCTPLQRSRTQLPPSSHSCRRRCLPTDQHSLRRRSGSWTRFPRYASACTLPAGV